MEDKSPSLCRLCNIALASASDWRQHAKDDWHVYNLRVRVAEPGTVVPLPSSPSSPKKLVAAPSNKVLTDESESDRVETELAEEPVFNSNQCLFCRTESNTFNVNLAHMSKEHGFTIPRENELIVEPDTLIGYLHLVIYGHGECIFCASRRSTVEGIQHHMAAKGHCRTDITPDIADFYNIPAPEYSANERILRLSSGKILSHRMRVSGPTAPRTTRHLLERRIEGATSHSATPIHPSNVVTMQDDNTAGPLNAQFSRLARGDQKTLAHLPDHEVRSLLATNVSHMDQLRREERHAQLKLDTAGNTTLTGHFRMDTSKRFRGPWG